MLHRLQVLVERRCTQAGVRFDNAIECIIISSFIVQMLISVPNIRPSVFQALQVAEAFLMILLGAEIVIRLLAAHTNLSLRRHPYLLIDQIVLVTWMVSGTNLMALRLFRLLRLLNVIRYSPSMKRIIEAFKLCRGELGLFMVASLGLIWLSGTIIYVVENPVQPDTFKSVFDALWWAAVTISSVGYGDAVPMTAMGKLFTIVIIILSMAMVGIPSGIYASALYVVRKNEMEIHELAEAICEAEHEYEDSRDPLHVRRRLHRRRRERRK